MNGKWTCKPETGVIFDASGTVIGVADKTSAISIVEAHNRALEEVWRSPFDSSSGTEFERLREQHARRFAGSMNPVFKEEMDRIIAETLKRHGRG